MSDTINKIELIGSKDEIDALLNMYSNYYPESPDRFAYKNINGEIGTYMAEFNEFIYPNGKHINGIPKGYIPVIKKEERNFPDFNRIIPMPSELVKELDDCDLDIMDEDVRCVRWSLDNWGTYQNAFEYTMLSETEYSFVTEICVPDLIAKISLKHPTVTIIYEYSSDEYFGFDCGRYIFQNGEQSRIICEDNSPEAEEIVHRIFPALGGAIFLKSGLKFKSIYDASPQYLKFFQNNISY